MLENRALKLNICVSNERQIQDCGHFCGPVCIIDTVRKYESGDTWKLGQMVHVIHAREIRNAYIIFVERWRPVVRLQIYLEDNKKLIKNEERIIC